jgi:succinoglycan biosynthesis protein ExoA
MVSSAENLFLVDITQESTPTVTVVIPAYNEAEYIADTVNLFCSSRYPQIIQILVADGGSTDQTAEIVTAIAQIDSRVQLVPNPQKIQSVGLNRMIAIAQGKIILRADAHADYVADYVEQCVQALIASQALNAGGSQRYVAKTPFQSGISLASRSWLTGVAKYRNPAYNGYADTVFLGCFWKSALDQIALQQKGEVFDTTQVRNQDLELNIKLRELADNAIYVSSSVKVGYFPRKTWYSLAQQYFKDGRGSYITAAKSLRRKPMRQKMPFLALSSLILLWLVDVVLFRGYLRITWLLFLCSLIPVIEALRVSLLYRSNFAKEIWKGHPRHSPPLFVRFLLCAIALFTMPISYAVGYGFQLIRNRILQVKGW